MDKKNPLKRQSKKAQKVPGKRFFLREQNWRPPHHPKYQAFTEFAAQDSSIAIKPYEGLPSFLFPNKRFTKFILPNHYRIAGIQGKRLSEGLVFGLLEPKGMEGWFVPLVYRLKEQEEAYLGLMERTGI